jgi:hypothetical protein
MARVFSRYAYTLKTTWKELEVEFMKIQSILGIVLVLSNNNFIGKIPKLIRKLKTIQQLNLSHNSLTGRIQS